MLEKKDFFFVNVHIPYEGALAKTDAFIPYNEIEKNLDTMGNLKFVTKGGPYELL